jgi:hypothetical protein
MQANLPQHLAQDNSARAALAQAIGNSFGVSHDPIESVLKMRVNRSDNLISLLVVDVDCRHGMRAQLTEKLCDELQTVLPQFETLVINMEGPSAMRYSEAELERNHEVWSRAYDWLQTVETGLLVATGMLGLYEYLRGLLETCVRGKRQLLCLIVATREETQAFVRDPRNEAYLDRMLICDPAWKSTE